MAHFYALRKALEILAEQQQAATGQQELQALQLRLSLGMLRFVSILFLIFPFRYIEPLRPDKAFYEAGNACRVKLNFGVNLFLLLSDMGRTRL